MKKLWFLFALLWSLQPAGAMNRGTTELGRAFVTGGVGGVEMDSLNAEKAQYSLAILTAAKGTGAYLANVRIRITDRQSQQVFETVMDGPWLLIDLHAGNYEIQAIHGHLSQKSLVTVDAGAHRQTVFYFDTHDQVEDASMDMEATPVVDPLPPTDSSAVPSK